MHRHKTCFHLPPSSRNSSSSCSTAWPRLTTRCFWETISTSASRCTPYYYTRHPGRSISSAQVCPPRLHAVGGGSDGARREGHRHASRAGRGPDSAPHLLPRDGALKLAQQ
eukprot:scaffold19544_cov63-Phaeocystis_antarctica.AAC.1